MAVPTTTIPSVAFALYADGDNIGGGTGGTLTLTQALNDALNDLNASWMSRTTGARSWSLSADALALSDTGAVQTGHTPTRVVSVKIGAVELQGITSVTAALSQTLNDIVNASSGLDTRRDPGARSLQLTIAADYYDPAAALNAGLQAIVDELVGATQAGLAVIFTVAGVTLTATMRPTQTTVTKSVGQQLTDGVTLVSDGVVTYAGADVDDGIEALLDAFFAAGFGTPLTVLAAMTDVGSTQYSGTAYPSGVTITAPFTGNVTVAATLDGHGPLAVTAVA